MKNKIIYRWKDEWAIPGEYKESTFIRFLYINNISSDTYKTSIKYDEAMPVNIHRYIVNDPFSSADETSIINLHRKYLMICPECIRYGYVSPYHQTAYDCRCFICNSILSQTDIHTTDFLHYIRFPFIIKYKDYTNDFHIFSVPEMIRKLPDFKERVKSKLPVQNNIFCEFYAHGLSAINNTEAAAALISMDPFCTLVTDDAEKEYENLLNEIVSGCEEYRTAEHSMKIKVRYSDDHVAFTNEVIRRIDTYPDRFIEAVRDFLCRSLFNGYSAEDVLKMFGEGRNLDEKLKMKVSFAKKYIEKSAPYPRYAASNEILMKNIRQPSLYGANVMTGLGADHIFYLTGKETEEEYRQKLHISRLAHYLFSKKTFYENFEIYCTLDESERETFQRIQPFAVLY